MSTQRSCSSNSRCRLKVQQRFLCLLGCNAADWLDSSNRNDTFAVLATSSVKSGHQQSCPSPACPKEESFLATCSFSGVLLYRFIDVSLQLTPPPPPLHGLYYGLNIKCLPQAHLLIVWEVMEILGYSDPSSCLSCSPSLCFLSAMNILLYHTLFLV